MTTWRTLTLLNMLTGTRPVTMLLRPSTYLHPCTMDLIIQRRIRREDAVHALEDAGIGTPIDSKYIYKTLSLTLKCDNQSYS